MPAELLRRYSCAEPTDTRFRAIARLRQSLWREQHGYACGRYLDANGHTRRLGSRVSYRVGRTGINLVDLTLVPLVLHEIAYREVGAVINVERLWTNLLTSQALTFNLFGPFKQRPALATTVMRRLVPDLVGEVTEVRFEHSPGRGHPGYTADYTAFDVLIRCTTPQGWNSFVAIEMKYSEGTGRHRLARPAPLRCFVAFRWRLPRSRRARAAARANRAVLARAVARHCDARARPLSRRPLDRDCAVAER